MLKSMTGFGKREGISQGLAIVAEVRSVNHRFREIVTRLPKGRLEREEELKAIVARKCCRGRIEITVTCAKEAAGGKLLTINRPVARQYYQTLQQLQKDFKLGGQIDIGLLASFREIFRVVEPSFDDARTDLVVKRLVTGAVADLDHMRLTEGKALQSDITRRLACVRELHQSIECRLPHAVKGLHARMRARVQELAGLSNGGEDKIAREVAFLADRCDVSEELTRLQSHLAQFTGMMKQREPVGRQLDFLLQEMGREVNTIGSKANDAEIAQCVVQLKSELEKIREQVQNVE